MPADSIDFGGVPEEIRTGGSSYVPPGDYNVKIVSAEKAWKNNDKSEVPYYKWRFQVIDGEHKGASIYTNTSLKPEALFNLRNLIWASSGGKINVAGKRLNFDHEKLYGKTLSVTVEDREHKEKMYSNVVDMRPLDDDSTSVEEVEEEDGPSGGAADEGDEVLEEVDLDSL